MKVASWIGRGNVLVKDWNASMMSVVVKRLFLWRSMPRMDGQPYSMEREHGVAHTLSEWRYD